MADWMMLDRFVYRRDDEESFPNESTAPLRATSSTSLAQAFHVAFLPAEPPAISRLYVRWPGGTTPEDGYGTDVAAAHRDLLLLRLTSIQDLAESPYRRHIQDHFVCVASSGPGGPRLRLKRLPVCTIPLTTVSLPPFRYEDNAGHEDDPLTQTTTTQPRVFFPYTVGLVRAKSSPVKHDEEEEEEGGEFVVAQLASISNIPGTRTMEAEVCVLRRSRISAGDDHDDDDGGGWEVKKIPIQHKSYYYTELYRWSMSIDHGFSSDAVVTFNHCICWVNYCVGGILFYEVFEEEKPAKISYLPLPTANRATSEPRLGVLEANRAVCVTTGTSGDVLKYITTIRNDRELYGPIPPDGQGFFCVVVDTLWTKETGEMGWVTVMVVNDYSLWARNTSIVPSLPHNSLMFPLVSMDNPNIAHFMLSEELSEEGNRKIRKVSVVTIDLVTKTVNSVFPYIQGDEDLRGEDADMVKEKSHLLKSFLPSQFPKFFNLTREHLGQI